MSQEMKLELLFLQAHFSESGGYILVACIAWFKIMPEVCALLALPLNCR